MASSFDGLLPKAECKAARSPKDFYDWVIGKFNQIGHTDEGKAAIRSKRGRLKSLVDELFPLAMFSSIFLQHQPEAKLAWVEGNQRYDAILDEGPTSSQTALLEVVLACDGYDDALQMEYLNNHGFVDLDVKLSRPFAKGKRRAPEIAPETPTPAYLGKQKELLSNAIQLKCKKDYAATTRLLVAFDDVRLREADHVQAVKSHLEGMRSLVTGKFQHVYIFGLTKRFNVEWSLKKT